MSVFPSLSFLLRFSMPLSSSGRPSAIGAASVTVLVVDSECIRWCPDPTPLGNKDYWRLGTDRGCCDGSATDSISVSSPSGRRETRGPVGAGWLSRLQCKSP